LLLQLRAYLPLSCQSNQFHLSQNENRLPSPLKE